MLIIIIIIIIMNTLSKHYNHHHYHPFFQLMEQVNALYPKRRIFKDAGINPKKPADDDHDDDDNEVMLDRKVCTAYDMMIAIPE